MSVKGNDKIDKIHLDEDELLILEISKTDDTKVFELIYDKYSDQVYRKCLSIVSSKDEAKDLTHDIFIKVFMKLKTFRGESKFSTWLYSITYYHCINHIQRNPKSKEQMCSDFDELDINGKEIEDEVEDNQIYSLKVDKLIIALERINPGDKMLLLMKYQDGLSIREIANLFEIGESAVKMRLSRAKNKLISVYEE